MSLLTESLVSIQADADIKTEMVNKLNSEDAGVRQLAYWYFTSGMACSEIQKYYDQVGGWE